MGRLNFLFYFKFLFLMIGLFPVQLQMKILAQEALFTDSVTVTDCIGYALKHQPLVKQLKIDEQIADQTVKISLSDWFPTINSTVGYQHYIKQPVTVFPDFSNPSGPKIEVTTGVRNYSNIGFSATQNIFNSDLYLAGTGARYFRRQAKESGQEKAIQLAVDINKAFYDVLLTQQMLNIINEDIDRLSKSLQDALALYRNGVKDKIDYNRATLALNSARSQKITTDNSISAKLIFLKQMIGYPEDEPLMLRKNFSQMKRDIIIDTLERINYNNRIEYKLLQTNIRLQKLSLNYSRLSLLPSLSANANYNLIYQNDSFSSLYNKSFPNSTAGLTLNLPLFQGTRRIHQIRRSKLYYDRLLLDTLNLKNVMVADFARAMAVYKSNLAAYNFTAENIKIARDVYNTVLSQYREGVKSYLEVIISETDLRTAQLNNLSSMIMLMFSKIDVDKSLGKITVEY